MKKASDGVVNGAYFAFFIILFVIVTSKFFSEIVAIVIACCTSGPLVLFRDHFTENRQANRSFTGKFLGFIIVELIFILVVFAVYAGFSNLKLVIALIPVPALFYGILAYILIRSGKRGTATRDYTIDQGLTDRLKTFFPDAQKVEVFVSDNPGMRRLASEVTKPVKGVVIRKDASDALTPGELDAVLVNHAFLARGNYATRTIFYIFTLIAVQFDILIGGLMISPSLNSFLLSFVILPVTVVTVASIVLDAKIIMRIAQHPMIRSDLDTVRLLGSGENMISALRKIDKYRQEPIGITQERFERMRHMQEKQLKRRIDIIRNHTN